MKRLSQCSLFISLLVLAVILMPLAVRGQDATTCAADTVVQPGDTLSVIASRYYGNTGSYTRIVTATNTRANNDASYATITNVNLISVGWKLCVPGPLIVDASSSGRSVVQISPTPTATSTPISAPTPPAISLDSAEMHPLQIEYMQRQAYFGSNFVLEQVLAPGENYNRYVASYQSEGNKIFALLTLPQGAKPESGWPVVVFNHGYIPPEIYRTTERYIAYTNAFSRAGYIVLKPDYLSWARFFPRRGHRRNSLVRLYN